MEKMVKKEPENARNLAKNGRNFRNFEAKCPKFWKIFLATLLNYGELFQVMIFLRALKSTIIISFVKSFD